MIDVRKLRQRLQLSQNEFATRFGFNVATLQQWEQGRTRPDKAASALLRVISHSPETVAEALRVAS
jgi:putative transcriptional regulator